MAPYTASYHPEDFGAVWFPPEANDAISLILSDGVSFHKDLHETDSNSELEWAECLLGTWSYCSTGSYRVSRGESGHLRFDERHGDGQEVSGFLHVDTNSDWLHAEIYSNGKIVGDLRLRMCFATGALISAFKLLEQSDWGPELVAHRVCDDGPRAKTMDPVLAEGGEHDVRCSPSMRTLRKRWGACSGVGVQGCMGLSKWFRGNLTGINRSRMRIRTESERSLYHQDKPFKRLNDLLTAKSRRYVADLYELQRRQTLFHKTWQAPFLPHDSWQGLSRWVDPDYGRHPWIDCSQAEADLSDEPPLLAPVNCPQADGSLWAVDVSPGSTDEEGWQYAVDFYVSDSQWGPESGMFHCRRRRWRCMLEPSSADGQSELFGSSLQPSRPDPAHGVTSCSDSGDSSAELTTVLQAEVPHLDLMLETKRLLSDEWGKGCFLMDLLNAQDATEIQVDPWFDDKGVRCRRLSMRIPVPPQPMAPSSSRATTTYRISAHDREGTFHICIDSTMIAHDVPYGDYFVVLERIVLASSGDNILVTKQFSLEFSQSTFLQSVIEASAKRSQEDSGQFLLRFVQERANHAPSIAP